MMLFGAVWILLVGVSCTTETLSDEECDKKSAEQLFKAIADQDPKAFPWIDKSILDDLEGCHPDVVGNISNFVSDLDKNVPVLLAKWKKAGEEAGIDWQDVTVDTVYVNSSLPLDTINTFITVHGGSILLHSKGKPFKIKFEQALQPSVLYRNWRTIALFSFVPLEPSPDYTPPYKLVQDKDFKTFYISLAMCFQTEALSEVNKIFLINSKGEKVYYSPNDDEQDRWELYLFGEPFDNLRENFIKSIKEGDCKQMQLTDLSKLDLSVADSLGLDKDELLHRTEFREVYPDYSKMEEATADVMGSSFTFWALPGSFIKGMFMKYKGMWYYVGDLTKADI